MKILTEILKTIMWTFLVVLPIVIHAAEITDITRLRQNLLRNYDNQTRPVQNHKDSTQVDVSFYLEGFELDERRNILTVHVTSVFIWMDEHMKWDPKDYGNLIEVQFAGYELWRPDFGVYNNVEASETDHFENSIIWGGWDSTITWIPPSKFQVACQLDLKLWPFDTQTCEVVIGSWTHSGDEIFLNVRNGSTKLLIWDANESNTENDTVVNLRSEKNREWDVVFSSVARNVVYYSSSSAPWMDVTITMHIKRKGSTHIAVIVAVAHGIAAAMLLSFWLSPHANERMPLILVTFMLNVIFLNNVYKIIASNGNRLPLVVAYYRDSLLMVTFGIIWTVLLRYIAASKRTSTVPFPPIISSFLNGWGATVLCLDPRPKIENSVVSEGDEKELVNERNPCQEDWTWLAHLLDRCMFIIYLIVYICFFVAFF